MQGLIPLPNQPVYPNNYLAIGNYSALRDNVDFKINYNPKSNLQVFRALQLFALRILRPALPRRGPRGRDRRRTAGNRARPDPNHWHGSDLYGLSDRAD